jgi:L-phenylalanine/L-methionine N-acetyltransferase
MIRKAIATDFDFIYNLYMHPLTNGWLTYDFMEAGEFAGIFKSLLNDEVLYIFEEAGVAKGMFKLIPLQHRNAHIVYLGGVAIHPDFGGKGLGSLMMQEIIALAKAMQKKRIELTTAAINNAAIRLYEKMGFQKEGVLKNFCYMKHENRFLDEALYALLLTA